ncbi:MAG: hypothetical protein ACHQRK_08220, partial [Gemmatimonadales bacterium]
MRPPLAVLAISLLVSACVSGTRVVYVPVPASGTSSVVVQEPPLVPVVMTPVGVTIVQATQSQLLVSLDQPAYLAVFEIVPERGVTLVYPASTRQRQVPLAGSQWLSLRWRAQRG